VSKLLKKGSKAAKAWGAKMRRLRGGGTKRRKSTRKGQVRKTARRAYTKVKSKAKSYKRRKSSSGMKLPKIPSVIKKVAIGVGAASLAGMAIGWLVNSYSTKDYYKILQVCSAAVLFKMVQVDYNEHGTNSAKNDKTPCWHTKRPRIND